MKRIVRKRTKGWRMPDNAVYVGRPGKLGNPFFLNKGWIAIRLMTGQLLSIEKVSNLDDINKKLVSFYKKWLTGKTDLFILGKYPLPEPPTTEEIRQFVNGRDVACWCSLDKPCHADVIIEVLK